MKTRILIGVATALCAITSHAQNLPDFKLSEFKLKKHISGDDVKLSELEGKVVAIEYWGTR